MEFIMFILALIILRILMLASIKGVYNVLENRAVNRKIQIIIILFIYILSVKVIVDKSCFIYGLSYELSHLISYCFDNIFTGVNNSLGIINAIACVNENSLSNIILLQEAMNIENIQLIQNAVAVEMPEHMFWNWNYQAILVVVVVIDLIIAGVYKIIKTRNRSLKNK